MRTLFVIAFALLLSGSALAQQNCQPLFARAMSRNLDDRFLEEYQKMRGEVLGLVLGKQLGAAANKALSFQSWVYKETKSLLGVGPKELFYDYRSKAAYMGTLQGEGGGVIGGNRVLILPPAGYDKTYVTLTKRGGRAGATISACVKDRNDNTVNHKEKSIGRGQETTGQEVQLVFFATADKYLAINVIKTDGLNDFEYTVSVTGEFNQQTLQQENNTVTTPSASKESAASQPRQTTPSASPAPPSRAGNNTINTVSSSPPKSATPAPSSSRPSIQGTTSSTPSSSSSNSSPNTNEPEGITLYPEQNFQGRAIVVNREGAYVNVTSINSVKVVGPWKLVHTTLPMVITQTSSTFNGTGAGRWQLQRR